MAFWFAFFLWLGTNILSALLAKPKIENARPSGLDDFQVPTATEGRAVPIIVGKVKMAGPNVVWYGNLETRAIREKVGGFLGIGGKNVTKAYQYYIGVQMVISSGPIDGVDRIWMGDREIDSGESSGDRVITDLDFFGGEDRGGGIDFTLQFFNGADGQPVSTYLQSQLTLVPRYENVAYMILNDGSTGPGYIGDAAQLRNIAFEPFWYPNTLAVTGGKERIGDDANPICFLYELLVANDDWGITMPGSDVLVTGTVAEGALRAVAEEVADEELGFSMVIDRPMTAAELIKEIERHVDGKFRLDLSDGRFKIVLARPETGPVPLLDESNIEALLDYSRPTWTETFNQVRVTYADRAKEYDRTAAIDQDLANLDITGRDKIHTLSFPGVKTASVAVAFAAREMFTLGAPIARAQIEVKGQEYKLFIGSPVEFSWADHEVSELPMRVSRIRYGNDRNASMRVDLVEDIFRLEPPGIGAPPLTAWVPPNTDAVAPLESRIWEPPTQLRNSSVGSGIVVMVARDGGLHLNYDIYVDFNGGTDNLVLTNDSIADWTPVAELQGVLLADTDGTPGDYISDITIDGLVDVTLAELIANQSTTVDSEAPFNVFLIDDELMWYETAADGGGGAVTLSNVHRGAFGTVPVDHADDARIWFPTLGAGSIVGEDSNALFSTGQTIRARVVTRTATGELAFASAPNIPLASDYTVEGVEPYAPGDVQVNSNLFVDDDWTETPGVLRTTWRTRNRFNQAFETKQDAVAVSAPGPVGAQVEVKRVDNDAIVASTTFANSGQFNASNFIPVTTQGPVLGQGGTGGTPGVIAEKDFYIELRNREGSQFSQQWTSPDFEVFGFGLDFGSNFGGQDTGGPNLGVVSGQASAPVVITPVPTTPGDDLLFTITVAGSQASQSQTASTGLRLLFSGFDQQAQEVIGFSGLFFIDDLSSKTLNQIAQEIKNFLVTSLVDRPFTVSRSGAVVSVRTSFGDLGLRTTNLQGTQNHAPAVVLQEEVGAQASVPQVAFIDYYDLDQDDDGNFIDVLAPSNGSEYQNAGNIDVRFGIVPITENARQQLEDEGVDSGAVRIIVPVETATDSYNAEFSEIATALNSHANSRFFTASGPSQANGLTINPMTRAGVVITMEDGFDIVEQTAAVNNLGQPSGHVLLAKRGKDPVPAGPLPRVTRVFFRHNTAVVHTNVVLSVNLDGTIFSQTVAAPGNQTAIKTAIAALHSAIDASGPYDAILFERTFTDEIRITGGDNVQYEAFFAAGFGPRIEFRRIVE